MACNKPVIILTIDSLTSFAQSLVKRKVILSRVRTLSLCAVAYWREVSQDWPELVGGEEKW